jgi:5,10-methylene-tetrahydrofolate dehydrogenase/methenyl tetrahydrofolate cyclohydrolase
VIGRSPILGKPVGMLLLARDATVTYCHSKTTNLPAVVSEADILIAAAGRPELIKGDWTKRAQSSSMPATTPATSAPSNTRQQKLGPA